MHKHFWTKSITELMKNLILMFCLMSLIIMASACRGTAQTSNELGSSSESIADMGMENADKENKEYFSDQPGIETPDSRDSDIKLVDIHDGSYIYSLGYDNDKSMKMIEPYLRYLLDQGLDLDNVSDELLEKGIIKEHMLVYYVKKDNKVIGHILLSCYEVTFVKR